jgi:predicted GH43/DUF377 family glycosyl hydrolase
MKRYIVMKWLLCLTACLAVGYCRCETASQQLQGGKPEYTGQAKLLTSYDQLMRLPLRRFADNPIIRHSGKDDWKQWQVQESFVLPDPDNETKLIMFYSGAKRPGTVPGGFIGRATASLREPMTWTDDARNPILSPGFSPYAEEYLRLDSMLYLDGEYWLYATGMGRGKQDKDRPRFNSIMLARSTDGIHFKWNGTPVLLPTNDENDVSQGAVLKEGNQWYMYYSYRTRSGHVLPGIRLATSDDGLHWKKIGQILSCTPGAYDAKYYEWHQILKLGDDYVLVSECFDGTHWCAGVAHSKSALGGWTKSEKPLLQHSNVPGTFDVHHVATPALFEIGSRVMLYYQGGNNLDNYIMSNWDIGTAVSSPIKEN